MQERKLVFTKLTFGKKFADFGILIWPSSVVCFGPSRNRASSRSFGKTVRTSTYTQRNLAWSAEAIAREVIGNNAELVQVWTFQRITTFVRAALLARPDPVVPA